MKNDKDIVKSGYNCIANEYLASRTLDSADVEVIHWLLPLLPINSLILDAGCGAGIPISRLLSQEHRTVGIDFAIQQLVLAHELVPQAFFACQDISFPGFPNGLFDAICSYYAIIHIPRNLHAGIFTRFFNLLKPSGLALLCLGANDLEADKVDDYLGAPMFWSHFDAETNMNLLTNCGFKILKSTILEDASWPGSGHLFVLLQK